MLELTADTRVDLARSAARHGAGLFETIRVLGGRPLRLEAHMTRLAHGAAFLGLDAPPDADGVGDYLAKRTNCAQLASGVLRLFAVDAKLMVSLAPWEPVPMTRIDIAVAHRVVRRSSNPLNRFKTMAYLENLLLAREAEDRALFEVIALNEHGRLTDGGRTSLFLVLGGRVVTPALAEGAMPGTARAALLERGLAEEAELGPAELERAEAAFLTNALRGLVPVHGVEGRHPKDARHPAFPACAEALGLS